MTKNEMIKKIEKFRSLKLSSKKSRQKPKPSKTALRLKCLTEILKNLPLDSILSAGLRFSPTASTPLPLRSSLATFTRALPSRPAAADSPLAAK